ncbi:MAG: Holliday junction branch migration protein RuvA [Saprospiraceae bacterium]|nr:Holliday junction branch migration protein RuvA [Saprospiraceae bacterium]
MIAYIKGEITYKTPTQIFVEAHGVGYAVNISLHTYAKIEKEERAKLYTYYHVNMQDYQPSLYGFADELERNIFLNLIDVKGISVNSARVILSHMTPEEVRTAIVGEDENAFKRVKGVGAKTAKQIILDLKDKMIKSSGEAVTEMASGNASLREDALAALVTLQVPKVQAQKLLQKIMQENPEANTTEAIIKLVLKQMR